jgi:hypothetical protein
MSLRDSLVAKIWSSIERSPFTPADFEVSFTGDYGVLLSIAFRHKPEYTLLVKEDWNGDVTAEVSPGEHKKTEKVSSVQLDKLPDMVSAWAKNVRDELRATIPVYSEVESLREALEQHIKDHVENPDQPFTEDEVGLLRTKLDELLTKFQEMQERSEITEQELNRLNREIASIRENLPSYPKNVWYKTAANRLLSAVGKVATSRESRQVLAQAAQRLLGLGP